MVPVALTLKQALEFRLPTTPVKPGDVRRDRWQAAYGPALFEVGLIASPDIAAQVEIDALAALRPDDLTRIAEAAIAPYWDAGLSRRTARARQRWQASAQAEIDAATTEDTIVDIRDRAQEAADRFNAALEKLREAQDELGALDGELDDLTDEIEAPEPPELPAARIDETAHDPLIDLDWSFVDGTQALKARKAYADGDEGDAE